jgi:hypothetical protein
LLRCDHRVKHHTGPVEVVTAHTAVFHAPNTTVRRTPPLFLPTPPLVDVIIIAETVRTETILVEIGTTDELVQLSVRHTQ